MSTGQLEQLELPFSVPKLDKNVSYYTTPVDTSNPDWQAEWREKAMQKLNSISEKWKKQ